MTRRPVERTIPTAPFFSNSLVNSMCGHAQRRLAMYGARRSGPRLRRKSRQLQPRPQLGAMDSQLCETGPRRTCLVGCLQRKGVLEYRNYASMRNASLFLGAGTIHNVEYCFWIYYCFRRLYRYMGLYVDSHPFASWHPHHFRGQTYRRRRTVVYFNTPATGSDG